MKTTLYIRLPNKTNWIEIVDHDSNDKGNISNMLRYAGFKLSEGYDIQILAGGKLK